jgi:CubicO group peptidase (beta-lactamase class C family)
MNSCIRSFSHFLTAAFCCAGLLAPNAIAQSLDPAWKVPSNDEIRALLTERMAHNGVGMVIGVIEPLGRRIVVHGRSGAANGRPLDGDTIFQIGSVTRSFTTLLLADMVQRGEVALDDPAQKFLPPGVRMPQRGRPITLFDLAMHTSGLPSMPNNIPPRGEPEPYAAYTVEQLYDFLGSYQLERAPGEKAVYSNLGVALLGRLLARRAGMDYEALLKQRVLKPLAMRSTAIALTPRQSKRLAPGHDRYLQPVITWEMRTLPASGSLRSTANDLLNFLAAYLDFQSTSLRPAMSLQLSSRVPARNAARLGWASWKNGDLEIFMHDGGKEGYRAVVAFNPTTRAGVVLLANARTDERLEPIALHLLAGRALPPPVAAPSPRTIVTPAREILEAYEGRYQLKPDTIIAVVSKSGHLVVDLGDDCCAVFSAVSDRDFFRNTGADEITFQVDAGRVTGLRFYGKGREAGGLESAPRLE